MKKRGNDVKGFTLIEVIVAIAVVAILASIALPMAAAIEDRARVDATRSELAGLHEALQAYFEDNGSFPADLADLSSDGFIAGGFDDNEITTDSWRNDYDYTPAALTATLISPGVDRILATADDLTITVEATPYARETTRDEIRTIRTALRNYETLRVPNTLPALPAHWDSSGGSAGAFQELVDENLLPNDTRYLTDSWGSSYVYSGTPADFVTSPNL